MSRLLSAIAQRLLLSITFAILLSLISSFILTGATWAASSGLGVDNGHLSSCPASNNCVVSQNADDKHAIDPIPYHVDHNAAREILLKVLTVVPRLISFSQRTPFVSNKKLIICRR
ncbi:DUF1499 domain-containing protein [Nostoc sp.]|uniref:DUF1499 domain-containing protein n=1 Tax=Nostoc sp. TaxID=1180 RepID=UPI003FA5E7C5